MERESSFKPGIDQDGLLGTPADVQDRNAARVVFTRLHAERPENVLVWADNGYGGEEFAAWAQDTLTADIASLKKADRTLRSQHAAEQR